MNPQDIEQFANWLALVNRRANEYGRKLAKDKNCYSYTYEILGDTVQYKLNSVEIHFARISEILKTN